MSKYQCPECYNRLCKKHPLQDSGASIASKAPIDKNGILNKLYNDLIGKELTKQKMEKIAEAAEEEKRAIAAANHAQLKAEGKIQTVTDINMLLGTKPIDPTVIHQSDSSRGRKELSSTHSSHSRSHHRHSSSRHRSSRHRSTSRDSNNDHRSRHHHRSSHHHRSRHHHKDSSSRHRSSRSRSRSRSRKHHHRHRDRDHHHRHRDDKDRKETGSRSSSPSSSSSTSSSSTRRSRSRSNSRSSSSHHHKHHRSVSKESNSNSPITNKIFEQINVPSPSIGPSLPTGIILKPEITNISSSTN